MSANFSGPHNGETIFVPPYNEPVAWQGKLFEAAEGEEAQKELREEREEKEDDILATTMRSLGVEEETLSGIISPFYLSHIRSIFTLIPDRLSEYRFVDLI